MTNTIQLNGYGDNSILTRIPIESNINAVIVSDLHLGSRYFLNQDFEKFLYNLPEGHELVLNGDVLDSPSAKLPLPHQRVLDLIQEISRYRKVVWIRGNHDKKYLPEGFENIDFKQIYGIKKRLLIAHGDRFDEIMPKNQIFIRLFEWMHNVRIKLGARPVHVAYYAKKWGILYKYLRNNVMENAVRYALRHGYQAVTCGHSHYPEYKLHHGIYYINTGSWTEYPAYYLQVSPDEMRLNPAVRHIGFQRPSTPSRERLVGT